MATLAGHVEGVISFDRQALKRSLVERYGIQQATKVYGYHQLLALHGPIELQRRLGPARYGTVMQLLREAGLHG